MDTVRNVAGDNLQKIKKFHQGAFSQLKEQTAGLDARFKTAPIKQQVRLLVTLRYIFGGVVLVAALVIFMGGAIYRGYFDNPLQSNKSAGSKYHKIALIYPTPSTTVSESPSPAAPSSAPSQPAVLGAAQDSENTNTNYVAPAIPQFSPFPTNIPLPTFAPVSDSTSSDNSTGNSNCSTSPGKANNWYSDFYPVSPVSVTNGSTSISVTIRDCLIKQVSTSDSITISLNSGDASTQVNGNALPYTFTASNGQATLSITTNNTATDVFTIHDVTNNFDITDTNNHNLSIDFSSSSSPTATPAPNPTSPPTTQTPTLTPTSINAATPTSGN